MADQTRVLDGVLPKNSTDYERTIASVVDRLLGLGIPIRDLWNPEKCPEDFLPYLGWALSVDVWDSSWPIEKQRAVIGRSFLDHQLKGTLALHERYIAYAGSDLIRATTPPQAFFAGAGDDDPVYDAWLASLPEVQIRISLESGLAVNMLVIGGEEDTFPPEGCLSASYDEGTTADDVATWFAGPVITVDDRIVGTYIKNGVTSPINVTTAPEPRRGKLGTVHNVEFNGTAAFGYFLDDVLSVDRFLEGSVDGQRVVLKLLDGSPEERDWNLFGLDVTRVQDVAPVRVPVPGFAPQETFANEPFEGSYLDADDPEARFYYSLRAYNGSVKTPNASFLDFDRFAMKPFTAEMMVSVREPSVTDGAYAGFFANTVYALPESDLSKLWLAMDASSSAKSLRDTILFDLDIPSNKTFRKSRAIGDLKL